MPLWPDGEDTALTTVVTFLSIAHTHLGKKRSGGAAFCWFVRIRSWSWWAAGKARKRLPKPSKGAEVSDCFPGPGRCWGKPPGSGSVPRAWPGLPDWLLFSSDYRSCMCWMFKITQQKDSRSVPELSAMMKITSQKAEVGPGAHFPLGAPGNKGIWTGVIDSVCHFTSLKQIYLI